jgi:hypothetical protein
VWLVLAAGGARAQVLETQVSVTGFCSRTAVAARSACTNEVRADFWTATGRCLNTAERSAREACRAEAREAREEDAGLCTEQFDARSALCRALGEGPYDPPFSAASFVDPLEIGRTVPPNPFFPLVPGSRWVYEGGGETVTVEVLGEVETVAGVPCTVVRDVVTEDGVPIEDTLDWFAQHVDGSVWYCGEISQEFEEGRLVSLDGSWRAGEERARPGLIMQGSPRVGSVYRQEFALGEAEDVAEIVSLTGNETTLATSCAGRCLVTRDFTPLEPEVSENKFYAPGVGPILEIDLTTGERLELVQFSIPAAATRVSAGRR